MYRHTNTAYPLTVRGIDLFKAAPKVIQARSHMYKCIPIYPHCSDKHSLEKKPKIELNILRCAPLYAVHDGLNRGLDRRHGTDSRGAVRSWMLEIGYQD